MKGIVLAGGAGRRLYPLTGVVTKQLQAVYDKPMIYYPLSTLILAGIHNVLLISTPKDRPVFEALLGDGSRLGIRISYAEQHQPRGIADAFRLGASFIGSDRVCLILGDNIFYGYLDYLRNALLHPSPAVIFAYYVTDPGRYGVIEFDEQGMALTIEEKPSRPRSHYAVPGLYVYDSSAIQVAHSLEPSGRGELEITDVNRHFLERGELHVMRLGRGMAWLDTGTHQSLLDAANFIATIETRQGLKIGCIEEAALRAGCIGLADFLALIQQCPNSPYRAYLQRIADEFDGD